MSHRPTVHLSRTEIAAMLGAPPIDCDAPTIEIIPLVQEPPRLARGSDAIRPRRRVVALAVRDILDPERPAVDRSPDARGARSSQ